MKSLYISYDGATEPLAQSQIIPYLKKLSQNKKINFILLTFEKKGLLEGIRQTDRVRQDLFSNDVKWVSLNYHKRPYVLSTILDIFVGIMVSAYIIKKYKVDVVHARSYIPALISLVLKRLFNIKFIFDMRGFWADERVEAGLWPSGGLLFKITKFFERQFLLSADAIVSLTNAAKKELQTFRYMQQKPTSITVIPTCVDTNIFEIRAESKDPWITRPELRGKFVFVYTGSVSTWYMLEEMLDFFRCSLTFIPNAHLLFITHESQVVQASILKKKINPDFFTIISVEHALIPRYLSTAKAGLAFYKPGYSRKACCPTKLGEYLACGIPVIINSGIGDSDKIIEEEGIGVVIKEFTGEEYLKGIKRLLWLLRQKDLKPRCRKVTEKYFSLEQGVEKYWKLYQQI